jgi:pimeloyl-ACP methyl ester carboxylesterase
MESVETSLGRLATLELGHAGPATLLWPSLYADHRSLIPIATELARTRRCILVDSFGHGKSANPDRRYTLAECGDAAQQVLDRLGIAAVDWIGNALGGHVGVVVALHAPARLRTLTVIGAPMQALSRSLRVQTRVGLAALSLGARDFVGKLVGKAMVAPSSPAEHADYVRACIREAPAGGIANAVTSVSLGRESLVDDLPRVSVPTLFVAGGDDPIWSADVARSQASRVPDVRFELVPGAGHLIPLERPRETLALIESFLATRSPAATGGSPSST